MRRKIVSALISESSLDDGDVQALRDAYTRLTDTQTKDYQREMYTATTKLSINIKDEIRGLEVVVFMLVAKYLNNCSNTFWFSNFEWFVCFK